MAMFKWGHVDSQALRAPARTDSVPIGSAYLQVLTRYFNLTCWAIVGLLES